MSLWCGLSAKKARKILTSSSLEKSNGGRDMVLFGCILKEESIKYSYLLKVSMFTEEFTMLLC